MRAPLRSPTRYLFHAQLLTPGPAGQHRFDQFMADIKQYPPILIVAQPNSVHAIPYFAGDLERRCPECSPEVIARLHTLAAYVDIEFELVDEISDWIIFERKTN